MFVYFVFQWHSSNGYAGKLRIGQHGGCWPLPTLGSSRSVESWGSCHSSNCLRNSLLCIGESAITPFNNLFVFAVSTLFRRSLFLIDIVKMFFFIVHSRPHAARFHGADPRGLRRSRPGGYPRMPLLRLHSLHHCRHPRKEGLHQKTLPGTNR